MELVSIADVQPGQVIARAVTDAQGTILCPAGFRLTESAISNLKRRGIESVVLEGNLNDNLLERLGQLEKRFGGVKDPVLLRIREAIEKHLRHKLKEEGD